MDDPKTLLILNGVPHLLSSVLLNAKIAPAVTIEAEKIHPLQAPTPETRVRHLPETVEASEREVIFFKQNTGYTVLTGRKKVEEELARGSKQVRGRLLSTPMLKKCRHEERPPVQMEPVRTLDRGARTYHRDDSYRGNRLDLPHRRESEQPYFPQYERQPRRS